MSVKRVDNENKNIIFNEKEFIKIVEPLIEWLLKNYGPMSKIIVEDGKIEIYSLEYGTIIETKMN